MNFRVLKAFLVVSRFGNITRASEFLHISQPALSRQIAELEAELDTRLFERTSRRLTLTANGLLFESRARELVKIYEEIRDELRQAENEYTGLIRFGCVESSVVEFVIDVFTELMQHYPHLTFELYAADGDDIREALDHGNLDMGILLEPVEAAKYESIPLPWSDRWGIVVSENSPEAKLENISIQQLSDMRLILPRRWIVQDEIASWMGIAREHLNVLMYHNLPTLPIRPEGNRRRALRRRLLRRSSRRRHPISASVARTTRRPPPRATPQHQAFQGLPARLGHRTKVCVSFCTS